MIKEMIENAKNALRFKGREERKRFGALDTNGAEKLDSTPMQPPIGYNPQPSMFDVMREQIARYHRELAAADLETPEEADDFDVDDDYDPTSPYEHDFDPPATPEVVSEATGKLPDPPADGRATPPATPAPAGSAAVPTAPAAKV